MQNIVILDGYTSNPGNDIGWDKISALGHLTVYDRTPPHLILERAQNADILLTNKTVLTAEMVEKLQNVKYIGLLSTGTNAVDLIAAKQRGIPVTNVPAYSTNAVAQMVFAYILSFAFPVGEYSTSVHAGDWANCADFTYMLSPLTELKGKILGIVGYGSIGAYVAKIARAFDMRILVHTRTKPQHLPEEELADLDTLLQQSDFVTLHCPLTEQTHGLIDMAALKKMKPTAVLINTSRGPVVCEQDLAKALQQGIIAGAAVDVMEQEPPRADAPLLQAPNCIITPHVSWASKEARGRLIDTVAQNIEAFLQGKPQNVVNGL